MLVRAKNHRPALDPESRSLETAGEVLAVHIIRHLLPSSPPRIPPLLERFLDGFLDRFVGNIRRTVESRGQRLHPEVEQILDSSRGLNGRLTFQKLLFELWGAPPRVVSSEPLPETRGRS